MKCPSCMEGKIFAAFPHNKKMAEGVTCPDCNGTGELDIHPNTYEMWKSKGELLKNDRIARKNTLREECKKFGYDPVIRSKQERGLMSPDVTRCHCCGHIKTFPTAAGKWEYKESFRDDWTPCVIKWCTGNEGTDVEEGSILFYRISEDEPDEDEVGCRETVEKTEEGYLIGPAWWPENVEWRKRV